MLLPRVKYFNKCGLKILLDINVDIRRERIMKRDNISIEYFNLREGSSYNYNYEDFDIVLHDNNYEKLLTLF